MFQTKVVEKIKTHFKMRFSFRIPKARKQTYTNNIYYLLLQNWLIASDRVQCLTATQKLWHCTRLIWHYELFSQTVPSEKTNSTLFGAASGNVHEERRTVYCCRRPIFTTRALLCNTQWHV